MKTLWPILVAASIGTAALARPPEEVREGSVLEANESLGVKVPDLRGELARERDAALKEHYRRLAYLDVITELAAKAGDDAFVERAETVRRKEMQRFHKAMLEMRQRIAGARP